MTPRTLAAFAAGALVGSLVQAVYDSVTERVEPSMEIRDLAGKAVDQIEPSATDEAERERRVAEILDMNARYARWRAGL